MTRYHSFIVFIALVGVAGAAEHANASPLDEVINSPLMRDFDLQTQDSVNQKSLRGKLKPDSNMQTIFSRRSKIKNLNAWVAPNDRKFLPSKERFDGNAQYVVAERTFTSITGQVVITRIFVAHPHYTDIAELGLMREFAELKPPRLKSDYSLPVKVQGTDAIAYRTAGGALALWIPVMKGVVIQMKTAKWADLQPTLDFAERLDFDRLRTKLET